MVLSLLFGHEAYGESASSLCKVYDVLTRNPKITSVGEAGKNHPAAPEQRSQHGKKQPNRLFALSARMYDI